MRLLQFIHDGRKRLGVEVTINGDIIDICSIDPSIPRDTKSFLEQSENSIIAANRAIAEGTHIIKREDVYISAPIENPEKIICLGMNYVDHCLEQNQPIPKQPILFFKLPNSIIGPGEAIEYPDIVEQLDYEVELGIVIGKKAHNVTENEAMDFVFGYTVVHDVSSRDWQLKKNNGLWSLGKTFDTFCPIGPSIVKKESLSDAHKLAIKCRVNGETMQDSSTEKMVFKTAYIVSYISQFMTLKPGDIISTGTPPGVGCFKNPPRFLKKGDVVEVEIEEIGCLSNPVK